MSASPSKGLYRETSHHKYFWTSQAFDKNSVWFYSLDYRGGLDRFAGACGGCNSLGLAILATEFIWARPLLTKVKERVLRMQKMKRSK
jgi:hypothetical protein